MNPQSVEFERLQRMAIADLFMVGLGSLLPYTMIEASLPAPYSYLQDLAAWAFGDERERERAFFGQLPPALGPLHEGVPVSLRGIEGLFGAVWSGNYDRLLNYTLITMFPWGRMGRDIFKVYNNPAYALDAFTGIPVHRIGQVEPERLPESPLAGP